MDLPQPDGPITATNSPGFIVKSTPRSARTGAPSDSKFLRSPRVTRIGLSSVMVLLLLLPQLRLPGTCTRCTVDCRPLIACSPSASHSGGDDSATRVASLNTRQPPGRARSCSRCARFTVSPTSVYSRRSSEPSSAAATGPVERPMPRPNGGSPRSAHSASSFTCASSIETAAANARSAWSSCATGAPKQAITASPTNCITVPSSSRIAWFIAARCSLRRCASALGSVVSAMPE